MGVKYSIPDVEGHSFEMVYNNVLTNVLRFSKYYKASYMWFYLQKLKLEMEGKEPTQKWQLSQRKWESYNRPLKEGVLYVLTDATGKKWKKRYCVMQSNYAMEVYNSKEEYENAGKARMSNKYSGHDVVTNVNSYLRGKLEITSRDFGYINHDISSFIKKVTLIGQSGKRPTQHIFCVGHDWRGITYFAAETAIEKDHWVRILKDSVRHLEGVQCNDEVSREAFTFALEQTIRFHGNYVESALLCGTQEEILADLFSDCQSLECKEILLPKIKGGFVYRFRTWEVVIIALKDCVKSIVAKEFVQIRQQCDIECLSQKQDIIGNLPQLNASYNVTSNAIKGVLSECFDPIVVGEIVPRLPEVVSTMSDSLAGPLRSTRELFLSLVDGVQKVVSSKTPQFANNIDRYFLHTLDFAPRDPDFVGPLSDSIGSKKPTMDLLEEVFPKTDFSSHLNSIFTYQQKLLDTAVYTFESLCGNEVTRNNGQLTQSAIAKVKNRVLKKLDYDIILAERRFFRAVIKSGTMEQTRESIEQSCKSKMLDFLETIPPDLAEYMPITNVFTDVLTKRFTELINPALTNCMKQLMSDTISSYTFRSSSALSSISSFSSAVADDDKKVLQSHPSKLVSHESNGELNPRRELDVQRPVVASSSSSVQEELNETPHEPDMDGETGEAYKSPPPPLRETPDSEASPPDVEIGDVVASPPEESADTRGETHPEAEELREEDAAVGDKCLVEKAENTEEETQEITPEVGKDDQENLPIVESAHANGTEDVIPQSKDDQEDESPSDEAATSSSEVGIDIENGGESASDEASYGEEEKDVATDNGNDDDVTKENENSDDEALVNGHVDEEDARVNGLDESPLENNNLNPIGYDNGRMNNVPSCGISVISDESGEKTTICA